MENVVDLWHGILARLQIAHIADIELDLVGDIGIFGLILVPHIVLFLLVAAENAYLPDIGIEKPPQHRVAERPRSPRYQ